MKIKNQIHVSLQMLLVYDQFHILGCTRFHAAGQVEIWLVDGWHYQQLHLSSSGPSFWHYRQLHLSSPTHPLETKLHQLFICIYQFFQFQPHFNFWFGGFFCKYVGFIAYGGLVASKICTSLMWGVTWNSLVQYHLHIPLNFSLVTNILFVCDIF